MERSEHVYLFTAYNDDLGMLFAYFPGCVRGTHSYEMRMKLLYLLQHQLYVITCCQCLYRELVPMKLSNGKRLPANGAGRAENSKVFHNNSFYLMNRVNAAKTMGAAIIALSSLSMAPPWPGMRLPKSLTPAQRLNVDDRRSPNWPMMPPIKQTMM